MRNSEEIISYFILSLLTMYTTFDYVNKNGTNNPTCFAFAICAYLLYAISGLIYYAKEDFSDSLHSLVTFGHRMVVTLSIPLYFTDLMTLKEGSGLVPREIVYGVLCVALVIAILAQRDGYITLKYADTVVIVDTLMLAYVCSAKGFDARRYVTYVLAIGAYYVYRNNVNVLGHGCQSTSNYLHGAFLYSTTVGA